MKNRGCLLVFFLLLSSCSHMFYYPDAYLHIDKDKIAPHLHEKELKGPEGKVIAWTFQSQKTTPATEKIHILFFHGNAENVSSHFYSLYWLMEAGYNYTIFDYPGYGGSEGEPSQKTTTETGKFMLDYLQKTYPDSAILIFGQSLGGNIALYSAAERTSGTPLCGTVIESSFLSYKTTARRVMARHWSTWLFQPLALLLVRDSYSAVDNIQKLAPVPLLVLHDATDPVVEFENGQDLFNTAPGPKDFVRMEASGHASGFHGPDRLKYQQIFLKFLKDHCQNYKRP